MNANGFIKQIKKSGYLKYNTDFGVDVWGIRYKDFLHLLVVFQGQRCPINRIDMSELRQRIARNFGTDKILFLLFTEEPQYTREELEELVGYWIYDTRGNRLMIYDDQPDCFANVEEIIENAPEEARTFGLAVNRSIINYIIVIANIVVFGVVALGGNTESASYLASKGGLVAAYVKYKGEYYRLFTSMFLHAGLSHIFNNMLVLTFIGDNLERAVGRWKFVFIYFGSGLIGSVVSYIYYINNNPYICCIGASGAIFGVIGALVYILIVNKGQLEDLKLSRMLIYLVLSVYLGFTSSGVCNVAHVSGFIAGFALAAVCYRKRGTN